MLQGAGVSQSPQLSEEKRGASLREPSPEGGGRIPSEGGTIAESHQVNDNRKETNSISETIPIFLLIIRM